MKETLVFYEIIIVIFDYRVLKSASTTHDTAGSLTAFYAFYYQYFSQLPIFYRTEQTIKYIDLKNLDKLSNRDYSSIPYVIESSGIFGKGSFFLYHLGPTIIVSHNLYLAFYAKYGIAGILFIVTIFVVLTYKLLKFILMNKKEIFTTPAIILTSVIIALFFQQLKISFIRDMTSIMTYIFFFVSCHLYISSNKSLAE